MIEIDFDKLKNIYKIDLSVEPNQNFDLYISGYSFKIELHTYTDERSELRIIYNDEVIVNHAGTNLLNINLNYFSSFNQGVFFFAKNSDKRLQKNNFLDFNDGLGFYYGNL